MNPLVALLAGVIGYLLGSLSSARLIGNLAIPEEDISKTEIDVPGSEQKLVMSAVSATSISMRAGPQFGCLTSILDMIKVAVPCLAFKVWFPGVPYFLIVAALGVVGHNWPLYYRAQNQTIEPLKTSGVCLGIDQDMGFLSCLEEKSIPVKSGDVLLLYSDGITEAMNSSHHLFDQSRLESALK